MSQTLDVFQNLWVNLQHLFSAPAQLIDGSISTLIVTAIIALLTYILKGLAGLAMSFRTDRLRFRSAIIRFHNDVELWLSDFDQRFSDDEIKSRLTMIERGPRNFRFHVQQSDQLDIDEIKPFLHRLTPGELRCIRGYLAHNELYDRMTVFIGSTEFGELSKERKSRAVKQWHDVGLTTKLFARLAVKQLSRRRRFLRRDAEIDERIKEEREMIAMRIKALSAHPALPTGDSVPSDD